MPNDIVIELWHNGGHWSLKKSDDQYWYKSKMDTEWKSGLPPGMKPHDERLLGITVFTGARNEPLSL